MAYDAIIVGARCAGAPTAMLLARAGLKVLLIDRARFPSDTISGHFIKDPGVRQLQRWGLLDTVLGTGCPRIPTLSVDFGGFRQQTPPAPDDALTPLAPRRFILDEVLVRAAAQAGAEVRERTSMTGLRRDGDQIVGVECRDSGRRVTVEHADIVVGADGRHSRVARLVDAAFYHVTPTVAQSYYAYWDGLSRGRTELFFQPGRAAGLLPTHHGQILAWVQRPIAEKALYRRDPQGSYLNDLRMLPGIGERLDAAERASRVVGMVDLPNFFRVPYGPGWALVGDAGHHKDPLIARGITDAFRDAQQLADAIVDGLGGSTPLATALSGYHQTRDAATTAISDLNVRLASLTGSVDEMASTWQQLLEAEMGADAAMNAALNTA